jgi:hypothetical protein
MKNLSIMRDNKIINEQTGYTMQDNLILCIGKTMRYVMRIPFLVCMAPLSMLIGHATAGVLSSPHCFVTSHIFSSILLRSGVLTDSFARQLNKLLGSVVYNYEYNDNNKKIEKTIEYNSKKEDFETYLYKLCLINDAFAGLLMSVVVKEDNPGEKIFIFTFAVVDYNKEKTQLIANTEVEKFGKKTMGNKETTGSVDITGGAGVVAAVSSLAVAKLAGISAILVGDLVKAALGKSQKLGIYEKKEIYVTVKKSDGTNIGEKITRVIPYVYACPTYYKEFSATSTISKMYSKLTKERIHTVVNIRKMEDNRFRGL